MIVLFYTILMHFFHNNLYNKLYNKENVRQVLRFLCAGTLGFGVNLLGFHILLKIITLHYLAASLLALSFSTCVGFLLQKFWTFRVEKAVGGAVVADHIENSVRKTTGTHAEAVRQFSLYVGAAVLNLGIDALVVYAMVDVLSQNKYLAQAAAAAVIALWTFFFYKKVLFVERSI